MLMERRKKKQYLSEKGGLFALEFVTSKNVFLINVSGIAHQDRKEVPMRMTSSIAYGKLKFSITQKRNRHEAIDLLRLL